MSHKTLLFDIDNTLLDFYSAEKHALQALLAEMDIELTGEHLATYQRINRKLWQAFEQGEITKHEIEDQRFYRFFKQLGQIVDGDQMEEKYHHYLDQRHELLGNSKAVLEKLVHDYDLYVVTNGGATTQYKRLKAAQLDHLFKDIFISEEIGYQKPMIEYFNYVFSQISNLNKKNTLLIGDSLTADILGGKQANIETVWLNAQKITNTTSIKPDYTIYNLEELLPILMKDPLKATSIT